MADGDSSIRVGALIDETYIFDFTHAYEGKLPDTSLHWFDVDGAWFQSSRAGLKTWRTLARREDKGWLVERRAAYWFAPVPRPGKLICIGLNYGPCCRKQHADSGKAGRVFEVFDRGDCAGRTSGSSARRAAG